MIAAPAAILLRSPLTGQQAVDQAHGLPQVSAAEQVEVIQHVIQVVKADAPLVARRQGPGRFVGRIELGGEATKQLCHSKICFPVAEVHGRIEEHGFAGLEGTPIAAPQVTVQQRRLRRVPAQDVRQASGQ